MTIDRKMHQKTAHQSISTGAQYVTPHSKIHFCENYWFLFSHIRVVRAGVVLAKIYISSLSEQIYQGMKVFLGKHLNWFSKELSFTNARTSGYFHKNRL
jgi:hypothetical protein